MSFIMFFAYWQVPYALGRLDRYLFRLLKSPKFLGQCLTHSRFSVHISWISWTNKGMLPETGALLLDRERNRGLERERDLSKVTWRGGGRARTRTITLDLCPALHSTEVQSQSPWSFAPAPKVWAAQEKQSSLHNTVGHFLLEAWPSPVRPPSSLLVFLLLLCSHHFSLFCTTLFFLPWIPFAEIL